MFRVLDFNFLGNQGGFPLNPQKVKLFAGGSTTTKLGDLNQREVFSHSGCKS